MKQLVKFSLVLVLAFIICKITPPLNELTKLPVVVKFKSAIAPIVEKVDADTVISSTVIDTSYSFFSKNVEQGIIDEINLMRLNPKAYAEKYIHPRRKNFKGKRYLTSPINIRTNEGERAVIECVRAMSRTAPMQTMNFYKPLYNLAHEQMILQGKTSQTGHSTPDGRSFSQRCSEHLPRDVAAAENISYGEETPREIVIQLLIDDGVPSRGHRINLLGSQYNAVGVAVGKHKKYESMCVMDFGVVLAD